MECVICGSGCELAVTTEALGKFTCEYFQCVGCSFIFAKNPHWLEESFTENQNNLDIGAVDRVTISSKLINIFLRASSVSGLCLDFGGGYGLLTRIMRDRGFNYRNYDPFTKPIFSSGFNVDPIEKADFYSLIEVALHFTKPLDELKEIKSNTSMILITAVVPPQKLDSSWWYLSPDTGQHVAIYPIRALQKIADELEMSLVSDGRFFHVLYSGVLPLRAKFLIRHSGIAIAIGHLWELFTLLSRALGKSTGLLSTDSEKLRSNLPWANEGNF